MREMIKIEKILHFVTRKSMRIDIGVWFCPSVSKIGNQQKKKKQNRTAKYVSY